MTPRGRILIIDDDKLVRWSLVQRLSSEQYETVEATSCAEAQEALRKRVVDLILLDYKLPDGTGLDVLTELVRTKVEIPVIMMTAYSDVDKAVEAMKLGAYDYIPKPFDLDAVILEIEKALENRNLKREIKFIRTKQKETWDLSRIVGDSPKMLDLFETIKKIALSSTTTVLLLGESGTGKGMVARAIHYTSKRASKAFMNITCSAMPETLLETELMGHEAGAYTDAKTQKKGLFELADQGTVFLDEIGDISPTLQVKLLGLLEDKCFKRVGGTIDIDVDVRIITATNANLEEQVRQNKFREDLYYRLKIIPIELPPLRERDSDVLLLAKTFIEHFNAEFNRSVSGLNEEASRMCLQYTWPGNVRELRNVLERAILLGNTDQILPEDLPREIREGRPWDLRQGENGWVLPEDGLDFEELEKDLVRQSLERAQGNQTRAAQLLGMNRDQIRYRIEKFGLAKGNISHKADNSP